MPKRCSDSDEVNVAVSLGLLTAEEVLETIKDLPTEKIVLFTGRDAWNLLSSAPILSQR